MMPQHGHCQAKSEYVGERLPTLALAKRRLSVRDSIACDAGP